LCTHVHAMVQQEQKRDTRVWHNRAQFPNWDDNHSSPELVYLLTYRLSSSVPRHRFRSVPCSGLRASWPASAPSSSPLSRPAAAARSRRSSTRWTWASLPGATEWARPNKDTRSIRQRRIVHAQHEVRLDLRNGATSMHVRLMRMTKDAIRPYHLIVVMGIGAGRTVPEGPQRAARIPQDHGAFAPGTADLASVRPQQPGSHHPPTSLCRVARLEDVRPQRGRQVHKMGWHNSAHGLAEIPLPVPSRLSRDSPSTLRLPWLTLKRLAD